MEPKATQGDESTFYGSRMFPDPNICLTKPTRSFDPFAECLVNGLIHCPYVMFSGKGQFCTHPRWRAFVEA